MQLHLTGWSAGNCEMKREESQVVSTPVRCQDYGKGCLVGWLVDDQYNTIMGRNYVVTILGYLEGILVGLTHRNSPRVPANLLFKISAPLHCAPRDCRSSSTESGRPQ